MVAEPIKPRVTKTMPRHNRTVSLWLSRDVCVSGGWRCCVIRRQSRLRQSAKQSAGRSCLLVSDVSVERQCAVSLDGSHDCGSRQSDRSQAAICSSPMPLTMLHLPLAFTCVSATGGWRCCVTRRPSRLLPSAKQSVLSVEICYTASKHTLNSTL